MPYRLLTLTLIAFLLSGCAFSRWLTESSSPEEIARLEQALAKAEQHREQVAAMAEKFGQDETARLIREADGIIEALAAEVATQKEAPDKPRWSTLVDLLLAGGTAAGVGWAAVAHRVKGKTEGVLRTVMEGVSEVRHEAKVVPTSLDKVDSLLFATYGPEVRHDIEKYRAKWNLESVHAGT